MDILSRKAQGSVDIALTVGSIVVPVVVLLSALLFAWAMISPITNAGRIVGGTTYDIAQMFDVVYSVPDDIKVHYRPSSMCAMASDYDPSISEDKIVCLTGFANISELFVDAASFNTEYPVINESGQIVRGMTSNYPVNWLGLSGIVDFKPDSVEDMKISPTATVSYTGSANLRDAALRLVKSKVQIPINKSVIIEKQRKDMFDTVLSDTMLPYNTANPNIKGTLEKIEHDPLEAVVNLSYRVCSSSSSDSIVVYFPPQFYLKHFSAENKLCLYKARIFPSMPYYMTNYYTMDEFDISNQKGLIHYYFDNRVYSCNLSGEKYKESPVYCFDFDDMPGSCKYNLSAFSAPSAQYNGKDYKFNPVIYPANYSGNEVSITASMDASKNINYQIAGNMPLNKVTVKYGGGNDADTGEYIDAICNTEENSQ